MSNKGLVKIKTETARINGSPPYLKAFGGRALPTPFITQAALPAAGRKPAQPQSPRKAWGAEGKHGCGF